MSLKRQVATGFFWVAAAQITGRGLSFLTTLILAKLLAPELFGLVGMATLGITALQYFQDIGFDAALIYRRDRVDEASQTAFYTVILTSFVVYGVAILTSPWIAAFFHEPEVAPVLRVLALSVPITSFGRVPYILLSREMNFRRKIFPELIANVFGSGASIVLALKGYGVWSLVWGQLVRSVLSTLLVWSVSKWRPNWQYSRKIAGELFLYGKHIVSSQTLIFLITNIDNAIVGRFAGQAALGFYQFAYNTSNAPATQLTAVVSQVMFPAFSQMRGDARQQRARYYLTLVRYTSWITLPMACAMILFAPEFIHGLYGNVWAAAIVPIQLLAVYGLIRSLAANMGSIFRAMGKPQWLTYIAAVRLAVMLSLLYPIVMRWGINGVSWLSVIVSVVDFGVSAALVGRLVEAPWKAYARILIPPGVAAVLAGLVSHRIYPYLALPKTALNLLAIGMILVVIYALLAWCLDRELRTIIRAGWQRAIQELQLRRSAALGVHDTAGQGRKDA